MPGATGKILKVAQGSAETQFIRRLDRIFGKPPKSVLGIGDDAALFPADRKHELVWTTDSQIENVHFRRSWLSPLELGGRAAVACLSDIVAMGAQPLYGLITFEIRRGQSLHNLLGTARGIQKQFRSVNARILGGNITASNAFGIHMTAIGKVKKGKAWLRSSARVGDDVFVTGIPGLAALAVFLLKSNSGAASKGIIQKWKTPKLRFDLVSKLKGAVHAAIDISDGLLTDAEHLAQESGVDLNVDLNLLPQVLHPDWDHIRLLPSDDYEILFTASSRCRLRMKALGCYRIGTVRKGNGKIHLTKAGTSVTARPKYWNHLIKLAI
jgi:thiamine-monophosphate kinase